METAFYLINDLNIVAKEEDYVPFIYDQKKGWIVDNNNVLSDRLIGYDGDTIGSSDMLFRVEEITKEEAMKLISEM